MIKWKLPLFMLLGLLSIVISCKRSIPDNTVENKPDNPGEPTAVNTTVEAPGPVEGLSPGEFAKNLELGNKLSSFFAANWTLIYHKDHRCEGSTDGQIDHLSSAQIDQIIVLPVKNDGDGWACDKKEPTTYDLDFDLKQYLANWDRFEIPHYDPREQNIIHLEGAGASDYLVLHYNDNRLITKLEYRSEDPG